jgi:hypothetical protein
MPIHSQYRQEWTNLGYKPDMGSAIAVRPPPREFLRVYHLTTAEFAISNIGLGRLKVARFADLNDPFELIALDVLKPDVRHKAEEFKNKCNDELGLLCFSADWTSPALWAHYAVKHTGICLGFDLKSGFGTGVNYVSERIKLARNETFDQLRDRLLYTKFSHWSYEEEIRVIIDLKKQTIEEGPLRFHPFSPDLRLAEVILGHRCTLSVAAVRRFTQNHSAQATTFKARPAWGSYNLVPLEESVP